MLTLTAGRSPFQEGHESALSVTFEIDAALPLTTETVTAAAEAFLSANGISGTTENPRVLFDGVTADEDGGTPKAKGRAKILSDVFNGDIWVRPARKAKGEARMSRSQLEERVAYLEGLLTARKIKFEAAA